MRQSRSDKKPDIKKLAIIFTIFNIALFDINVFEPTCWWPWWGPNQEFYLMIGVPFIYAIYAFIVAFFMQRKDRHSYTHALSSCLRFLIGYRGASARGTCGGGRSGGRRWGLYPPSGRRRPCATRPFGPWEKSKAMTLGRTCRATLLGRACRCRPRPSASPPVYQEATRNIRNRT